MRFKADIHQVILIYLSSQTSSNPVLAVVAPREIPDVGCQQLPASPPSVKISGALGYWITRFSRVMTADFREITIHRGRFVVPIRN
jgi:hypothetical protein